MASDSLESITRSMDAARQTWERECLWGFLRLDVADPELYRLGLESQGDLYTAARWFGEWQRELKGISAWERIATGGRRDVLTILARIKLTK